MRCRECGEPCWHCRPEEAADAMKQDAIMERVLTVEGRVHFVSVVGVPESIPEAIASQQARAGYVD